MLNTATKSVVPQCQDVIDNQLRLLRLECNDFELRLIVNHPLHLIEQNLTDRVSVVVINNV